MPTMRGLERILARELNPLRDFERVQRIPSMFKLYEDEDMNPFKQLVGHLYSILNCGKHVIRGGVVGAAVGLLVGEATGAPTTEAVREGALSGIIIDITQYSLRYLVEETVRDMPRVYTNVRTWLNEMWRDSQ